MVVGHKEFLCDDCIYRRTETTKYGKYARCKINGRMDIFKAKEICKGELKICRKEIEL